MSLKEALEQGLSRGVLRVAPPRGCNMQQQAASMQQAAATPLQQGSTEAPRTLAQERNAPRNNDATAPSAPTQQTPSPLRANVAPTGVWCVLRDGKIFAWMVGSPCSYEEAVKSARFHWPDADVKPRETQRRETA